LPFRWGSVSGAVGFPVQLAFRWGWLPVGARLELNECGILMDRAVLDKSHNRPASSARRLVIEATYPL
jgi:hypothetical protein